MSTIGQIVAGPGFGMAPGIDSDPQKVSAEMLHIFITVAPIFAVVTLLYFILASGLVAGAVATAYNLVTGGGADHAPPEAHA